MNTLTRDEYFTLMEQTGHKTGKRMAEILAFRAADIKYAELTRYCENPEADRNCYYSAVKQLEKQKTILPGTYKLSVRNDRILIQNINMEEA